MKEINKIRHVLTNQKVDTCIATIKELISIGIEKETALVIACLYFEANPHPVAATMKLEEY